MSRPVPKGPRWRRRPEDRPDEILRAALEVFDREGLAGSRIEDIATEAGVSKGTVYLYFAGKDELFREMIRTRLDRTLSGLSTALDQEDPARRLAQFIDAFWGYLMEPEFRKLYRLILAELHHFPDLARFWAAEVPGRVSGIAAEIIREGVEAGQFREVDPVVSARMLHALLLQHAVWSQKRELFPHLNDRTDDDLVAEIRSFYLGSLLKGETP